MSKNLLSLAVICVLISLLFTACGPAPTPAPSPLPTASPGSQVVLPDPASVRDAALAYLAELDPAAAAPADLDWIGEEVTPQGLVGRTSWHYTAGDWSVVVTYPLVAPEATIYDVQVVNQAAGVQWQASLDAHLQITEHSGAASAAGQTPFVPAAVSTTELQALAEGNSAFAWDLYRLLGKEEGNLFYSPYSISLALTMTYAGARGETERQMADTLHFDLPQAALHPAFDVLAAALESRSEGEREGEGDRFRLNVANSLWGQEGYPFLPAFLDLLDIYYSAGLRRLDFASAPDAARQVINDWVEEQTEGRIEDLIPPDLINSLTRLVLANAIYFNASWAYPFEEGATTDGPFHLPGGGEVVVPMMRQTESFAYAAGDGYQAIELPYTGHQISMLILLPDEGEMQAFEDSLDAGRVSEILAELRGEQVALTMPRFEFESEFSLADALIELGMVDAFGAGADFSGMTGSPDLSISAVVHKAFVSVDEEGTEAAAATAVIMLESAMPAEPVEMTVDRPFLFLIRDVPTGTLLFVGRVIDPTHD
ncbi:MAG: serpin family protein [Anaerolineae bacterium]|nr:serpin family protein [Anaerolineae bacterium]